MLIWAALMLIGLGIIAWSPSKGIGPTAAHNLERNTLLIPDAVEIPGYSGRYVTAARTIGKGDTLRPQDMGDQPALIEASAVRMLLSLPLSRPAVDGGVNAGSKIELCGKTPLSYGSVVVRAVHCDFGSSTANCVAAVELPNDKAGDIASRGFKDQTSISELRLPKNAGDTCQ